MSSPQPLPRKKPMLMDIIHYILQIIQYLRKTFQALKDLYNISILHQQIVNYYKTAAVCIKSFVDTCIMAMRMAFRHFKELPKGFRFITDGYRAYPLAARQFFHSLFNTTIINNINQ